MLTPPVVCWIVVLLQLEFRNLASLIEHPLFFGNKGSVECAAVEALENEIEEKQDSNQNARSQEQQPFVVVESPEYHCNDSKELDEWDDYNEACQRVLRAEELSATSTFLTVTAESYQAAKHGCNKEWKVEDADIFCIGWVTAWVIGGFIETAWAASYALSFEQDKRWDALIAQG